MSGKYEMAEAPDQNDALTEALEDGFESLAKALAKQMPPNVTVSPATVNVPAPVVNVAAPLIPKAPARATGFTAEITERDIYGQIKKVSVKFNY